MQPSIEVDKSQILPLRGREGFCRRTHAGHPIQLFVRASNEEARHECTLSGRTQPNRAHRTEGAAQRRQASVPPAKASADFAGRRCRDQRRGDRKERRRGSTVYRTKRRFVEGNLERALSEEPRPGAERKLTGKEEALLVATACASPPQGRARWTLKRLAGDGSSSPTPQSTQVGSTWSRSKSASCEASAWIGFDVA